MQRPLLTLCCISLLAAAASAQDIRAWSREQHAIERDERRFWKEFKSSFNEALKEFERPVDQARDKPNAHKEAVYDYAGINNLVEEAAAFGKRRGEADLILGAKDAKSADALFKALLDVAKQLDKIEPDLLESKPDFSRYLFDQQPGCHLIALETRMDSLIAALSGADAEFLSTTAWKKAARADGKRSVRRRMAILDACGKEPLVAFLTERLAEKKQGVRIAAAEALVRIGKSGRAALANVLRTDKSGAVRRSVLLGILAQKTHAGEWFEQILAHTAASTGYERDLALQVLARISHQKFGHDLAAWNEWHEIYANELKGGKFDVKTIEIADVKHKPDPTAFPFYGLQISSSAAVFVFEGSQHIAMPADVDVQRTRWRDKWRGRRHAWEKDHEAHETALLREFKGALTNAPEGFRWAMLMIHGPFATYPIGEKKLLGTKASALASAVKLIERAPGKGWCSPYQGLMTATRIGGDTIDSIVFWGTGDPSGGRFIGAPNAIRAWNRINRTRKLQIIAVRISNRKAPAEKFLKSIATQYIWAKKPPAPKSSSSDAK